MATEVVLDCTAPQELTSAHAQETTERALEHGGEAVAPPTPQRTRRTASEVWHSTTETSLSAHLWFHPPPYSVMTAPTLKKKKKTKEVEEEWEKTVINVICCPRVQSRIWPGTRLPLVPKSKPDDTN